MQVSIAKVRYTGSMRTHHRRGPSGTEYRFTNPSRQSGQWVAVTDRDDAREFDSHGDVFDVRWTFRGKMVHAIGPRMRAAGGRCKDVLYRGYQRTLSALNRDVTREKPGRDVESALAPTADELAKQMEYQK